METGFYYESKNEKLGPVLDEVASEIVAKVRGACDSSDSTKNVLDRISKMFPSLERIMERSYSELGKKEMKKKAQEIYTFVSRENIPTSLFSELSGIEDFDMDRFQSVLNDLEIATTHLNLDMKDIYASLEKLSASVKKYDKLVEVINTYHHFFSTPDRILPYTGTVAELWNDRLDLVDMVRSAYQSLNSQRNLTDDFRILIESLPLVSEKHAVLKKESGLIDWDKGSIGCESVLVTQLPEEAVGLFIPLIGRLNEMFYSLKVTCNRKESGEISVEATASFSNGSSISLKQSESYHTYIVETSALSRKEIEAANETFRNPLEYYACFELGLRKLYNAFESDKSAENLLVMAGQKALYKTTQLKYLVYELPSDASGMGKWEIHLQTERYSELVSNLRSRFNKLLDLEVKAKQDNTVMLILKNPNAFYTTVLASLTDYIDTSKKTPESITNDVQLYSFINMVISAHEIGEVLSIDKSLLYQFCKSIESIDSHGKDDRGSQLFREFTGDPSWERFYARLKPEIRQKLLDIQISEESLDGV